MARSLNLLIIEDSEDDAILIREELIRGDFDPNYTRVENADDLKRVLAAHDFELIISDFSLPQFSALEALKIVQTTGKDIPFIVVSGSVRESVIIDVMRAGARDYVLKGNMTRLPLAVARELDEAAERHRVREFDQQLRHTQRLESIGVLAGGIAHDFNNLLTGILGNTSVVLEALPRTSELKPRLEQVIQAAEQASSLTRQMLAYAGKGQFFMEKLDVSEVIRDISVLLQASVSRNIRLSLELSDFLPPIEADRGQIQQLVMNLVINAGEAIGSDCKGTVAVVTGTRHLTDTQPHDGVESNELRTGTYVQIEVRDTGPGMEPSIQARIFDPFFTTKFTGRGLGLSAVMGIVRSHRGTINVNTAPGKGSIFSILLPACDAFQRGAKRTRHQGVRHGSGVVLVIDDEEVVRNTAKAILERRGFEVVRLKAGLRVWKFSGRWEIEFV